MIDCKQHKVSYKASALLLALVLLFAACSHEMTDRIDELNERSYAWHYRNLDSTLSYAQKAYDLSADYKEGRAEALNNMAFVNIAKMEYAKAYALLYQVETSTNNQVELFIADVQMMRLCQRQSHNKDFYIYRESASRRLRRINEERGVLTDHQNKRLIYGDSEFKIINSTYFFYVGLTPQSIAALDSINPDGEIAADTAQLLNYWYNIGSGGIITAKAQEEINQIEFDYLMRCYLLARQASYPFFEAQALQALSKHLETPKYRKRLMADNLPAMKFINTDEMADSLLAGNLALRALNIFADYGDVYQTAGAYRTLAECYWALNDYKSAIICLQKALNKNTAIQLAPDLVASIREQLSLAYSAIDNKPNSDFNRNRYLDMQEMTRQDRLLEARADQLQNSSRQLNRLLLAVIIMIVLVCILLFAFDYMRRRNDSKYPLSDLLKPLEQWKKENVEVARLHQEDMDELKEQTKLAQLHVLQNKKRNLEQRAKVSLVCSITPFIDRMKNEVQHLLKSEEGEETRLERYQYMAELTDKINDYNGVLTNWIQLRQGQLSLHIESFPLQSLFDIVAKSRMSFQLRGITLSVEPTQAVVKADKVLTLFMVNTMADNARKFTPKGGQVVIKAVIEPDYVEINIIDNGQGMTEEQLIHLFDHKPVIDESAESVNASHGISASSVQSSPRSHGFGLMNCKGIIDKYHKISQIFRVCSIGAESPVASLPDSDNKGSRLWFRLPKGISRLLLAVTLLGFGCSQPVGAAKQSAQKKYPVELQRASTFADSVYNSNIKGTFLQTLAYADSARYYLNRYYLKRNPQGSDLMVAYSDKPTLPAELKWFHDSLETAYDVILSVRNESAVAALALHQWNLYRYNNGVFTQLFRERSADNTLGDYVRVMQRSENNKDIAIILLIILLVLIFPAYYIMYYRHRVHYRFCLDRVNDVNRILLSNDLPQEKLKQIEKLNFKKLMTNVGNDQYARLNDIVEQIKAALQQSIVSDTEQAVNEELAKDELRRAEYESDKLHVSNSILDNCLSTLKHETMYYPSRIRQLIDGNDENLSKISELVSYYKELYSILSEQALRQTEGNIHIDQDMLSYLFDILHKASGEKQIAMRCKEDGDRYVVVTLPMPHFLLTGAECSQLFTPLTVDVQFLLCRQVMREIGEATNARGCGIYATPMSKTDERGENTKQPIEIDIKIPKEIWKNSKLSS